MKNPSSSSLLLGCHHRCAMILLFLHLSRIRGASSSSSALPRAPVAVGGKSGDHHHRPSDPSDPSDPSTHREEGPSNSAESFWWSPPRELSSSPSAQCGRYSACRDLAGACCPTDEGVMLYCCDSPLVDHDDDNNDGGGGGGGDDLSDPDDDALCSRHPNCPDVDAECCPTYAGGSYYLDCCDNAPGGGGGGGDDNNVFRPPAAPPTAAPTEVEEDDGVGGAPDGYGPNVFFIDGSWTTREIQSLLDGIHSDQVDNEMGTERYAIYFRPGAYGSPSEPLMIQVGYYTEIAGLGTSPTDVVIHGKIEVYNRCFVPDAFFGDGEFVPTDGSGHCVALNNFWRSVSNLRIDVVAPPGRDPCRSKANFWAVSQASSMRRVSVVNGDVSLMDFCTDPAFASGGFLSDSQFSGSVENGSQQQWISRNIDVRGGWSGSVWNQVFLGSEGVPPSSSSFPDPPVSNVPETPVTREKPFLVVIPGRGGGGGIDGGGDELAVFVPSAATGTRGVSWLGRGKKSTTTPGRLVPMKEFLVATPSTPAKDYREALRRGKNLLLTPGVYDVRESLRIEEAHTVVLGLGHATLTARGGVVPISTSDAEGIVLAGITVDAGPDAASPALVRVGDGRGRGGSGRKPSSNPRHPITLSDVYFRVGGPHVGRAEVALEVNADHVLIDHAWIWRADHGIENFDASDGYGGDNERWRTNTGTNGAIVNGNDVVAMGLFVEHFQEHNLIWNGENGKVFMFQSELPYEPESQSDWTQPSGTLGYEAYRVGDSVREHYLLGGGVYCYNRNNPAIVTAQGFSVPKGRSGIVLEHIMTRNLSGPGIIRSIVNGEGPQVDADRRGPFYVERYHSASASSVAAAGGGGGADRSNFHARDGTDGGRSQTSSISVLSWGAPGPEHEAASANGRGEVRVASSSAEARDQAPSGIISRASMRGGDPIRGIWTTTIMLLSSIGILLCLN